MRVPPKVRGVGAESKKPGSARRAEPGKESMAKKEENKNRIGSRIGLEFGRPKTKHCGVIPEIMVFIFFILIHIPNLGHDNFNTDVWKWKSRSYNFGSAVLGGDLSHTLQTYHPGVTLMWLGSIGARINNYLAGIRGQSLVADEDVTIIFQLDFIQKLLVVVAIGIAVSFIFHVLRNILGMKYALFSVLMLSLEPFYLGLTRVFHLEGLVSTFMMASIVWLYYFFQNKEKKGRLVVSAIFAGLALLTKTSAFFLVLFTGLATIIYVFRDGNFEFRKSGKFIFSFKNFGSFIKNFGKIFLSWFLIVALVFFALWPAMWVSPGKVLQELYGGIVNVGVEGDHFQYYFGKLVEDPGPGFYFVVLGFKSSIYLLVGFIGVLLLFAKKKLPGNERNFLSFLLIFVFFYFIQLIVPTKKLDRYILPALVVMSFASSIFFVQILSKINFRKLWQKVAIAVLFLAPAIYTDAYVHPDYFSYFNPIFGGLKTGVKVLEPKWIIGADEIVSYFKELSKKEGAEFSSNASFEELVYKSHGRNLKNVMTVGFQEKYYSQVWPFFREFGAWAVIKDLAPFAEKTKYFVYPVWDDTAVVESKLKLSYFDTIKLRGVPLYNVYKNEGEGVHFE